MQNESETRIMLDLANATCSYSTPPGLHTSFLEKVTSYVLTTWFRASNLKTINCRRKCPPMIIDRLSFGPCLITKQSTTNEWKYQLSIRWTCCLLVSICAGSTQVPNQKLLQQHRCGISTCLRFQLLNNLKCNLNYIANDSCILLTHPLLFEGLSSEPVGALNLMALSFHDDGY